MRIIRYKQSEFPMPWKWRKKKPLDRFILEIPYGLYWSVVPGRVALNEVLRAGTAGGGMGTGLMWEPFELTEQDYREVVDQWRSFDLRKVLKFRVDAVPDLSLVFDDEILSITRHLDYLKRSHEKYQGRFWRQASDPGGSGRG